MARPKKSPETPSEVLSAVVLMRTPDGYVVGRAVVDAKDVEWISPKYVRDVQETRPQDIVLKAEKWANEDGTVTLKSKRVAKGTPVLQTVAKQVVFGEGFDAMAQRARAELKAQALAVSKQYTEHWRHICPDTLTEWGLPMQVALPVGKPCQQCGLKKASAA